MIPKRIHLYCFALVAAFLSGGCLDPIPAPYLDTPDKLRHPQLLERAIHVDSGVAGKRRGRLGMIVRTRTWYARIMERYQVVDQYKLSARFEYQEAFSGVAISIEDTTGGTDFSSILATLSADPDIEWLEPDFGLQTPRPDQESVHSGQRVPWSIAYIGGKESSTVSGDGQGAVPVDVYVLDTGVTHPDLNVVDSRDFRTSLDHSDPSDLDGHGTHVAGVLAAMDNQTGLVGVAPGARVHNYKVLDDDGLTEVSVVLAAVEELIAIRSQHPDRPMVVNLSLGEDIGSTAYTALDEALDHLSDLGAVVVVAAGNQGQDAAVVSPAHVSSVITVGAHDADGVLADFSNFGPAVDILAPGVAVVSLAPDVAGNQPPARMSGSSMAAPHVAGAAALYLSTRPAASVEDVRAALVASARAGISAGSTTTDRSVWVGNF